MRMTNLKNLKTKVCFLLSVFDGQNTDPPSLDWPVGDADNNKEVEWADDWDDDLVEGDFVTQLRQELANKAATKQ